MYREVLLTQGRVSLVDDSDYVQVVAAGAWQVADCGGKLYARHTGNHWQVHLHTFLTGYALTDHINGDGLDNRRLNLRAATASQNGANMPAPAHNTSGFKGVHFYRRTSRWRAYITVNQHHRHLGYFTDAKTAALAYDDAAIEAWGEFARLNFPTQETRS